MRTLLVNSTTSSAVAIVPAFLRPTLITVSVSCRGTCWTECCQISNPALHQFWRSAISFRSGLSQRESRGLSRTGRGMAAEAPSHLCGGRNDETHHSF